MKNENDYLKKKFDNIIIPQDLDSVVKKSIKKGKIIMKKQNFRYRFYKAGVAVATVFVAFVISINTIPAFADSVSAIPGISELVRVLRFDNNKKVEGGNITDGKDIKDIDIKEKIDAPKYTEEITISMYNDDGIASSQMSFYEITQLKYPYSIIIEMFGTRSSSTFNDIKEFADSNLVGDIYRLITLDDSTQRFAITFKKPVEVQISEMENPAKIIIEVKEKTVDDIKDIYSVRTGSYEYCEFIGTIEGILKWEMESENPRIIMDDKGTYIVEEGYYNTEAEAISRMEALDLPNTMYIEKRGPSDIPKAINE